MQFRDHEISQPISNTRLLQLMWRYAAEGPIISVASTSNCSLVAAGSVDRNVYLISKLGDLIWKVELDDEVWAVDISAKSRHVVAGTASKNPPRGSVYVLDFFGNIIFRYHISAPIWSVSITDEAKNIVASSWNNQAYNFKMENGQYGCTNLGRFGESGLYGIKMSKSGSKTILAAYRKGIIFLDSQFISIEEQNQLLTNGLYNVAISSTGKIAVVGCLKGKFYYIEDTNSATGKYSTTLSDRPICGISMSEGGQLIAAGSFDGKAYLSTNVGKCLWAFQTNGEVWSTSMSSDGTFVCIGSGDHGVYLLKNNCTSAVIEEIEGFEKYLINYKGNKEKFKKHIQRILETYSQYGLVEYAVNQLNELCIGHLNIADIDRLKYDFLEKIIPFCWCDQDLHKLFARQAEKLHQYHIAIRHNQIAAINPELYYSAMINIGRIFQNLGLNAAARSSFRRAIIQELDVRSMNVLYNLARSYEDCENWDEAITLYEVLISWDINFRNSWKRLQDIKERKSKRSKIDYTGVTVNLIGSDSPKERNIDPSLCHITSARSEEISINEKQREATNNVFTNLEKSYKLPLSLRKTKELEYDEIAYIKYDYLPAEDEIKKQIEMIYELLVLEDNPKIVKTLDVGAATGRHPLLLANKNLHAIGIDIEERAMRYASKIKDKMLKKSKYPLFCIGDSIELPFRDSVFDMLTCMMGTFAHISNNNKLKMLLESYRVLDDNGIIIISTWDKECEHLSLLTIYNEEEKNKILELSLTQYETRLLMEQVGFKKIELIPFIMLPNVLVYELDIHKLQLSDLKRAIEIDMATRCLYASVHGEMFMIVGRK